MAKRAMGGVPIATEVASHRGYSAIGTVQRHYRLRPVLASSRNALMDVVVVSGSKGTYVFPAGRDGVISDHFNPLNVIAGVYDPAVALSQLGYNVAAPDVRYVSQPLLLSLARIGRQLRSRLALAID
ncbi:Uncharacterised protein [Mycobacteroides abscessus subsp. massiliense]|nr:Uncharacterised protein [Mycobacteroides abscessus subsp. massiliense]